jgi:beta-galactosidase
MNQSMTHRTLLILLAFALLPVAFPTHARQVSPLADWRFKTGDLPGAEQTAFDDSGWQALSLPHCWGQEQAERGQKPLRATGWYRHALKLGQPKPGRRYFVRFEAAATEAEVFVNGTSVGQHRGGYGAFCFEITKRLATNGANILVARVRNTDTAIIAPLSGDFPQYGGVYRPVQLIETDAACFTPTDHGSPGVAWRQTSVDKRQAVLDVTAQISNGTKKKISLSLVARVLDAKGKTVATVEQPIALAPESTEPHSVRVTIPRPHLWHGRKDPYLHRAIVELRDANGVRDAVEQPLGLRSFRIDPDRGFFLNGEPYHLHGVNRHQEVRGKGWAITEADQDADMALLKEIGATVVRCAHYQHSDYFYTLCDQAGMLVWAEIPQVDRVGDSEEFAETSKNQLLDLIRQNVNHPSIFCWSLFNELRPNSGRNPDPHRLLQDLQVVANGEDPTRPTIAATCTTDLPQMNKIPDLLGWNVYYGWYGDWGPISDYDPMRAQYRYTSRHGGYCVSEYGAGGNVDQHEQNPRKPKNDGQWHPEEYQNVLHEHAWPQLKAAPYIWGTFVWVMFDFTSYWRNEGGVKGLNDKGLITADRKTKKDAFYYYKANWSEEPTLYITSRRHTTRTNAVTDVKIYSNAKEVELLLNGTSQGKRRNDGNGLFVWKDLRLKPGENSVEAKASRGGVQLSDRCVWTLKP